MAILHLITLTIISLITASPQLQRRQSTGCNDACYSAIATYNSPSDPYAGNGICYSWLSHYPPAQTTETFTGTEYLATVSETTFRTRIETVWSLATNTAAARSAPQSAAPSPTATTCDQGGLKVLRRQTTNAPSSSSVPGLPLPNSNIASSCTNDPASFASACSCIGDEGQTHPAYTTTSIPSTSTAQLITRECTSTVTAEACAATSTWGMQANRLHFGDTSQPSSVNSTFWSTGSTAAECCFACYHSDQNCRFYSYTPPTGSSGFMANGGTCFLNLEGNTCPMNVLPPNTFPYDYNYITEGMYAEATSDGTVEGFGPCAVSVPYFYGYQNGRAGVGVCSADTATTTVFPS